MTTSEQKFIEQLGTSQWELVKPCGSLWNAKGKTVYVRHKRRNIGAPAYLKTCNFIADAQEAGGDRVIQVKLK